MPRDFVTGAVLTEYMVSEAFGRELEHACMDVSLTKSIWGEDDKD